MVLEVTEGEMINLGLHAVGFGLQRQGKSCQENNIKRFCSFFGATPLVCSIIFRDLQIIDIGNAAICKPKVMHFLMTLNWLKRYQVELTLSGLFKLSEESIRK